MKLINQLKHSTSLRTPSLTRIISLTFYFTNEPEFNPWGLFSHLVKQRVEHADAEHPAGSERQPEHEGQVGALISLYLETNMGKKPREKQKSLPATLQNW